MRKLGDGSRDFNDYNDDIGNADPEIGFTQGPLSPSADEERNHGNANLLRLLGYPLVYGGGIIDPAVAGVSYGASHYLPVGWFGMDPDVLTARSTYDRLQRQQAVDERTRETANRARESARAAAVDGGFPTRRYQGLVDTGRAMDAFTDAIRREQLTHGGAVINATPEQVRSRLRDPLAGTAAGSVARGLGDPTLDFDTALFLQNPDMAERVWDDIIDRERQRLIRDEHVGETDIDRRPEIRDLTSRRERARGLAERFRPSVEPGGRIHAPTDASTDFPSWLYEEADNFRRNGNGDLLPSGLAVTDANAPRERPEPYVVPAQAAADMSLNAQIAHNENTRLEILARSDPAVAALADARTQAQERLDNINRQIRANPHDPTLLSQQAAAEVDLQAATDAYNNHPSVSAIHTEAETARQTRQALADANNRAIGQEGVQRATSDTLRANDAARSAYNGSTAVFRDYQNLVNRINSQIGRIQGDLAWNIPDASDPYARYEAVKQNVASLMANNASSGAFGPNPFSIDNGVAFDAAYLLNNAGEDNPLRSEGPESLGELEARRTAERIAQRTGQSVDAVLSNSPEIAEIRSRAAMARQLANLLGRGANATQPNALGNQARLTLHAGNGHVVVPPANQMNPLPNEVQALAESAKEPMHVTSSGVPQAGLEGIALSDAEKPLNDPGIVTDPRTGLTYTEDQMKAVDRARRTRSDPKMPNYADRSFQFARGLDWVGRNFNPKIKKTDPMWMKVLKRSKIPLVNVAAPLFGGYLIHAANRLEQNSVPDSIRTRRHESADDVQKRFEQDTGIKSPTP